MTTRTSTIALTAALTACSSGFDDPVSVDVGDAEICVSVAVSEREWTDFEEAMVAKIGQLRGEGGTCGQDEFGPDGVVAVHIPELRCAARLHARDIAERGTLTHIGSDGSNPIDRIAAAGYVGIPRGQIIAAGQLDPEGAIEQWLADKTQCGALRDAKLKDVGVGLVRDGVDEHPYWVVTFGSPTLK